MNKLNYLLKLKSDNNIEELFRTWQALGSLKVDNSTKIFNKDTLFLITEEGSLKNALVWCSNTYTVDPSKCWDPIDWTVAQANWVDSEIAFYQGVVSPFFKVIIPSMTISAYRLNDTRRIKLTIIEKHGNSVEETQDAPKIFDMTFADTEFIPFKRAEIKSSVIDIDDAQYTMIASELGIPFLNEDELEYNRDTILDICVRPALDQYYAYFPIVIDESKGRVGGGVDYEYEYHSFPEDPTAFAYKGIPYMTVGVGGFGDIKGYTSPFSYMRESVATGYGAGSGSRWGRSINWNKSVPGPYGNSYTRAEEALLANAAQQGYMNYFRREYERDVFKDGKKYIHGHSTIGGNLNIHWLCASYDFSRVDYWMLPQVRKLCTAYALRNIGMLNALIKPNETNPIDYSLYNSRADALEKEVLDSWSKNPAALMFAIKRAGNGGR